MEKKREFNWFTYGMSSVGIYEPFNGCESYYAAVIRPELSKQFSLACDRTYSLVLYKVRKEGNIYVYHNNGSEVEEAYHHIKDFFLDNPPYCRKGVAVVEKHRDKGYSKERAMEVAESMNL